MSKLSGLSDLSLGGDGNNNIPPKSKKRIAASKIWCLTINNHTNDHLDWLSGLSGQYDLLVWQEEEGEEEGTPHIQGVIKYKKACRPLETSPIGIHWSKCRNVKASVEYCQKVETRKEGGKSFIYPTPYNVKIDLYDWQKDIIDIIKTEPDDRSIYWYWSREGNVGKTTFCKFLTLNFGAIPLSGKGADIRNGVLDHFNKKNEYPRLCVFPIPRSYNSDYLSYEGLENIKDMYFYSGKYEGGCVCGPCPHLFVFSNCEPNYDMCSTDRWRVVEIV